MRPIISWIRLTQSVDASLDPEKRRRAALLSSVVLAAIFITAPILVLLPQFTAALPGATGGALFGIFVTGFILLVALYALSRTHYYLLTATATVTLGIGVFFALAIVLPGSSALRGLSVLALLFAGVFLSLRATAIATVITIGLQLLLNVLLPQLGAFDAFMVLVFVVESGVLILATAALHQLDVEQIRSQTQKLARERMAERLQTIVSALAAAQTPEEVAHILVTEATQVLSADAGLVALSVADGSALQVVMSAGYSPDVKEFLESERSRIPMRSNVPVTHVMRRGRPLFLSSKEEWVKAFPDAPPTGYEALAVVPLRIESRIIGVLGLSFAAPRPFTDVERAFGAALAQQCAQALERAQLFAANVRQREELEIRVNQRTTELKEANKLLAYRLQEKEQAEQAREASELYARSIVDSSLDMIITTDLERRIVEFNRAAQETFGYTRDEVIGKPVSMLYADETQGTVIRQQALEQGEQTAEVLNRRKNGEVFPSLVSMAPLRSPTGKLLGVVGVSRDISEIKRIQEQLRNLSLTDELTGLYNRRGFMAFGEQHLKLAYRARRGFLLFFLDMNRLKLINDTWGHPVGDAALQQFAGVLRQTFRDADIVARTGGDEFTVLCVEAATEQAAVMERLYQNIARFNAQHTLPAVLSYSIGCASYDPDDPCSLSELMQRADRAMYLQKRGSPE